MTKNNFEVISVDHPLGDYKERFTRFECTKQIKKISRLNIFGPLNLIIDFYLSLKFIAKHNFDIFIGANNFDTLAGIFSRFIFRKKIKKIIYFASDYSENRFKNRLLNNIYYLVESISCKYSDLVISNTKRAEKKRLESGLVNNKSIVVPNGVLLKDVNFANKLINKQTFIYIGSITKEHGLYEFINKVYPIMTKLVLIGEGEEWEKTVMLCKNKGIKLEIYYKKSHDFCIDYLKKFKGIGLAPYNTSSMWTYYCSPLKISEYIACGIPVLMSSVPEISEMVIEKSLGVVYSKLSLNDIRLSLNAFDESMFSHKAHKFYDTYNQNYLYERIKL
ncbi:MAG: glycosyltransferase [Candidatus Roizmanbacteria bacterium]|nr:glycosyltransferase [Candidatus Roizmanbacteria bacterium]